MAFTHLDEKLLVRAYQAGDERAFDTIVRTQHQALYAHALRRLNQHEAAEDAVQDTLIRAYRALPNLDGDLALRAWLHRILTNVCHDEGNRRRRQQGLVERVSALPEELGDDPVDEAVLHDTVRIMSDALRDLPDSYREALVLRYVDGLSFREVAEATGITEENARARVQRGRTALHKVLSRIAVMLAFVIPGLRRTQGPASTPVAVDQTTSSGGLADHTVNLATQLTSHVMASAPTVSRFAEMSSAMSGNKSALAAAAVTAVAAVAAPVAAYTVHEASRTPSPPPAVAAPAPEFTSTDPNAATTGTKGTGSGVGAATTTSTSLPPSQAHPFEAAPGVDTVPTTAPHRFDSPTTSSTSTTVPANQGPLIEGHLGGDAIHATGAAPQWDASGPVSLVVNGKTTSGTIAGRIYVYDDGTAESDTLEVDLGGKTLQLRYRGKVVQTTVAGSTTTYDISGAYVFSGASGFGLAERGDVGVLFRVGGDSATLSFDLRGHNPS